MAVGAHAADFVWRAGGALAWRGGRCTASVIALSYGEKGESGELWKEEGQTIENVKKLRHAEAEAAAKALGADFTCFDLGDYPLEVAGDALTRLVDAIREVRPDVLITHTDRDPSTRTTRSPSTRSSEPGRWRRARAWRARSPRSASQVPSLRAPPAGALQLHP